MTMTALAPGLRKWLAFGTGVGIEIGARDLNVVVARVRPSGAAILGSAAISEFRERPAAEWGGVYTDLLKRCGDGQLTAAVVLPREDVIVRLLHLPGVAGKDIEPAIRYQLDSLHPYGEDDTVWSWAPVGASGAVLIGIAQRATVGRYAAMFAEAGVKVSSFMFSAAAVYSALRMVGAPPAGGFIAASPGESGIEIYGESPARPAFSAALDMPPERAVALAVAELRLPADSEPLELHAALPKPASVPKEYDFPRSALAYAAALAGACSRLALPLNLLPAEQRSASSRAMLVPTLALAVLVAGVVISLAAVWPFKDRQYMSKLQAEIATLEPRAQKAAALDRSIAAVRANARALDEFRVRSKADLDALQELTNLLQPPSWVRTLELTRTSLTVGGEADQAAPLLKTIDGSPLFQGSEFTMPIARVGSNESFRVRAERQKEAK